MSGAETRPSLRVLLLYMPFGGVDRPPLGLGNLKAGLAARNLACDVTYLNFDFAQRVGSRLYQWFCDRASHMIFAGEWMFAKEFLGEELPSDEAYFAHLRNERQVSEGIIDAIIRMQSSVRPFLDHCLSRIDWEEYDVIGFSSTFEQNMPSLALAHAIKSHYPDKIIIMGGANCESSMGVALHKHFCFLDYVFTGAADETFPDFIERLSAKSSFADIPGIVYRDGDESRITSPARPVRDINALPYPDFRSYFEQLSSTTVRAEMPIRLQMETSRGCWWGMKHHCTFCGFNAATMKFGSKSAGRVLAEIEHLVSTYGITGIDAVDAIVDLSYFQDVFPELAKRKLGLSMYYEIKANLTKAQIRLLSAAGVKYIQPGIESFSAKLLKQMRKGISPLQNLQVLKWSRQYGLEPSWNLLYGFPGETPEDYEEMLKFIKPLTHLTPPRGCGRLRMDRFSPHFDHAKDFGFENVRPLAIYRYIYPLLEEETKEIAYFFDYDFSDGRNADVYAGPLVDQVRAWQEQFAKGAILTSQVLSTGELRIVDGRAKSPRETFLEGWRREVYELCDRGQPAETVMQALSSNRMTPRLEDVRTFLEEMAEQGLVARSSGSFLSLAVSLHDEACDAERDLSPVLRNPRMPMEAAAV